MEKVVSKKIVFLDRDGVINKKAEEHCYITKVEDFVFNDGIFDICKKFKNEGYEFIVITNQRGVVRGLLSEETLQEIHEYMKDGFHRHEIEILDIFYCPHDKSSCDCRKPKDGMLKQACLKYKIDLFNSILISDTREDVSMGKKFGIGKNIFVESDYPEYLNRIKIAFIKYGGLTSGGSEKLLQIIAANLPKNKFDVNYFYCDPAPHTITGTISSKTDKTREDYLLSNGINFIKFKVDELDIFTPSMRWVGDNFFDVFNEDEYDIIQTCRAGHKEYPFIKIKNKPIVDIIALSSGSDNQYNIARVLHLCKWSALGWIKRGGDKHRVRYISLPISLDNENVRDLRKNLNIGNKFVFGMHQRSNNDIFSEIPLLAYKEIENDKTLFILMGGGSKYKDQAQKLNVHNIIFLKEEGDSSKIFSFLKTLNVFAHGRIDGEVNSQAMAEAMFFGLPIVSHRSKINNGHVECINEAGNVVKNVEEYKNEMLKLMNDKNYYNYRSNKALEVFKNNYELEGQIKNFIELYEDVYNNPFPNKINRFLSSLNYTQNIRVLAVWFYLKYKKLKIIFKF